MNQNVNMYSPICRTSYGIVSFLMMKEMAKSGKFNMTYSPIGGTDLTSFQGMDMEWLIKASKSAEMFDSNAPCFKIFHENKMDSRIGSGKLVGYSFFEGDKLSETAVHHASQCDTFCVSSQWAKDVALNSGVTSPVEILHPVIDYDLCRKSVARYTETKPKRNEIVKFLHIGKMEDRKNQIDMIKAFGEAFDQFDPVELHIMWDSPFNTQGQAEARQKAIQDSPLSHKIKILGGKQLYSDVISLYGDYDVYVSLSRAEGWDMPLFEALSCGMTAIATNVTAHTEFIDKDNCVMVESKRMIPAVDGVWFFGDSDWHDFSKDDIVSSFQEAFDRDSVKPLNERENNSNKFIDTFDNMSTINKLESILR